MLGDQVIATGGWTPVERVTVPLMSAAAFRVLRLTRCVGPGDQDATVVTLIERPGRTDRSGAPAISVVSAQILAGACHLPAVATVVDSQLRWWTEHARRHVDIPALGIGASVTGGGTGGWPAIGSPDRRRIWLRRVQITPLRPHTRTDDKGFAFSGDTVVSPFDTAIGVHLGLLTEWPILVGGSPRRRERAVAPVPLVGPEVICREGCLDSGIGIDLRGADSGGSDGGPGASRSAGLSPG